MNRTPIASPLLLVGRDATETWHGSDDEYREVGLCLPMRELAIAASVLVKAQRARSDRRL
jgi:hypothetical protein